MLGKEDDISKFKNVIADIYESFIAAVYIVYGIEKARKIVLDVLSANNYLNPENLEKIIEQRDKEISQNEKKPIQQNENEQKKLAINKQKVDYNKENNTLLRKFVGKTAKIECVEYRKMGENVIVKLLVNGKVISWGKGKGKRNAKNDAIKEAYKILQKKG